MNQLITVKDKQFILSISNTQIEKNIQKVANQINNDYQGLEIYFVGILNGSFMFAAKLLQYITLSCKINFTKLSSYQGTQTTGNVKQLIGLPNDLKGKHVIILEDIVDTGLTIKTILPQIEALEPIDIKVATLLFKPKSFKESYTINYSAIEVPNDFIVGYGLDYDGYGRNLPDIYTVVN